MVCGITDEAMDDSLLDIGGTYKNFYREFGIACMIQRPDFIIFGVAQDPGESSSLVDDLRRQLIPLV